MNNSKSQDLSQKSHNKSIPIFLKIVYGIFGLIILFLCIISFIRNNYGKFLNDNLTWMVGCGYLGIIITSIILYFGLKGKKKWIIMIVLFFFSLFPRIMLALTYEYVPHSDFKVYYEMGVAFANGNSRMIYDTVASYKIPEFAGLGILNGIIISILYPSMQALQISNAIMTSVICIFIFLIGEKFNVTIGIIAALLFAIYPSNIIMTQVSTNQHGAILCTLISIYFLIKATDADIWFLICFYGLLSGFFLRISQCFHPSTITTFIAIAFYTFSYFLIKKEKIVKHLSFFLVFGCTYFVVALLGSNYLSNNGYCPSDITSYPYLAKVVVGLNHETLGICSFEDYDTILDTPKQEQNKLCLKMIKERISDIPALCEVLYTKTQRMWADMDSSFEWYNAGLQEELLNLAPESTSAKLIYNFSETVIRLGFVDVVFMFFVYLLALLGVLFYDENTCLQVKTLLLLLTLGWMGVHVFIETQPRYRYYAIPFLCIFASMGISYIIKEEIFVQCYVKCLNFFKNIRRILKQYKLLM